MSHTTNTMRVLSLAAIGDLRLERRPIPTPEAGKVRVRIGFCGVCGSDIPRVFTKGTYHFPTVCGHEFAGTIDAVGDGVTSVKPGDRVAVFPLLWCGKCESCESGKYVQCSDYDYLGSRRDGAFSEYVVAPIENLIRVPDSVSLEVAAMTEPASVALHALRRIGRPIVGQVIAIWGAGPIGLMVAQWARAMGARDVVIFDVVDSKLELTKKLGFSHAYNSRSVDPQQKLAELTGGRGANVAIDAAGVPQALVAAMRACARGGNVVLLGNPSGDVTVPAELLSQMMRSEVTINGTWNSDYAVHGDTDDWRTTLAAMASGQLNLKPLITHRVVLEDAADALRMMRDNKVFFAKVLVHP